MPSHALEHFDLYLYRLIKSLQIITIVYAGYDAARRDDGWTYYAILYVALTYCNTL